jgi:hypothetical protein
LRQQFLVILLPNPSSINPSTCCSTRGYLQAIEYAGQMCHDNQLRAKQAALKDAHDAAKNTICGSEAIRHREGVLAK